LSNSLAQLTCMVIYSYDNRLIRVQPVYQSSVSLPNLTKALFNAFHNL